MISSLIRGKMTERDNLEDLKKKTEEVMHKEPPTIAVIGKSGGGKSTTINRMFKTSLPVSHTVACTKEFINNHFVVPSNQAVLQGIVTRLCVVDAPGLGEDVRKDPTYMEMYRKHLGRCDVILWVMSARDRAIALDQMYLDQLKEFSSRMVFGVNQVDLIHPMNWDHAINLPSVEMEGHIAEIVKDRASKLASVAGTKISMIPYSAERGYNLEQLFHALIDSAALDRRWVLGVLKNFSYRDFYQV